MQTIRKPHALRDLESLDTKERLVSEPPEEELERLKLDAQRAWRSRDRVEEFLQKEITQAPKRRSGPRFAIEASSF